MRSHELNQRFQSNRKRAGRGISSGHGKTAGRGTKGQNARSGGSVKPGFEGGQNPIMKRLPKLKGFRSHKTPYEEIYTSDLNQLGLKKISNRDLAESKLISSPYVAVKLLDKGDLTVKTDVEVQAVSKNARYKVESAGGSVKTVDIPKRQTKTSDTKTTDK